MKQWLLRKWYLKVMMVVPAMLIAGRLYMGAKGHDTELDWNWGHAVARVTSVIEDFHHENGRLPHNYEEIRERAMAIQDRETPRPQDTFTWEIRINDCPELPAANGWREIRVTFHDTKLGERHVLDWVPINLAPSGTRWEARRYRLPNGSFRLYESDRNVADAFAEVIDWFHNDFNRWPVDTPKDRRLFNAIPLVTGINEVSSMDNFSFEVEGDGATGWIIVRSAKTGYTYKYPTDGSESPRRPQEIPPK